MDSQDDEKWGDLSPDMRRALKKAARNVLFWETFAEKCGGLKVVILGLGAVVAYATGLLDFLIGAYMETRGG